MEKNNNEKAPLSELRAQAEGLINGSSDAIKKMPSEEDTDKLIHELQVHQIELEVQNEALRKTQAELEESRSKYFELYDLAPIGLFTLNPQGVIIEANLTGGSLLGAEKNHLLKNGFTHFIAPDFQDAFYLHRREVIDTGMARACELRLVKKDGAHFYAQVESSPSFDATGNFIRLRIAMMDLTGRKQAEQARQEIAERFQRLSESSFDGILMIDERGKVLEVNKAFNSMLGYQSQELIGREAIHLVAPESRDRVIKNISLNYENSYEAVLLKKDGSKFEAEVRGTIVKYNGRDVRIAAIYDLTGQKLLIKRNQQHATMKAISSLAGGISHRFNNTLSGIFGNIELLKLENMGNNTIEKYADRLLTLAKQMAALTDRLLAYAQGGKYRCRTISLSDFIGNSLPLIKSRLNPGVQVEAEVQSGLFTVTADETQLQMVISEIIKNAEESMNGEGRVKLTIQNEQIDGTGLPDHPDLTPGNYIRIRITDDGKGMNEETKQRIFEPFFTTNFQGRGLGMAAVYGIVKNHKGSIGVDSKPGEGTSVSIFLPASEDQIKEAEKAETELIKGAGTILLIEDKETVMQVEEAMIKRLGYWALIARTGKEAINILNTFRGNIDLTLLDIGLPDMGGKELFTKLMEARPFMKVIVCTGYAVEGPAQEILSSGAKAVIQKPFTFAELSAAINKVLERRQHRRFKVKDSAVALPESDPPRACPIVDISKGGLAFRYREAVGVLTDFEEIAISMADAGFSLDNVPCKTISDLELPDDSSLHRATMKRRGVRFGELTASQTYQLESFLETQAIAA